VRALNVATAAGGALRVIQPQARVRRLLQLAGLVGILTTVPVRSGSEAR
jgi:hypothetical protein